MALFVSKINYEHREIKLNDKPQEFLSTSSTGTVPVFITSEGDIIEESLDIMKWSLNSRIKIIYSFLIITKNQNIC